VRIRILPKRRHQSIIIFAKEGGSWHRFQPGGLKYLHSRGGNASPPLSPMGHGPSNTGYSRGSGSWSNLVRKMQKKDKSSLCTEGVPRATGSSPDEAHSTFRIEEKGEGLLRRRSPRQARCHLRSPFGKAVPFKPKGNDHWKDGAKRYIHGGCIGFARSRRYREKGRKIYPGGSQEHQRDLYQRRTRRCARVEPWGQDPSRKYRVAIHRGRIAPFPFRPKRHSFLWQI